MQNTFLVIIEILGTLAFAISGIRLASAKRFDWFGAYVVGLITAVGGGTLRDVLLGLTPFWMLNWSYLAVTGVALLLVIAFGRYLIRMQNTFFIFDTIGLALFVVVGIEKTLAEGFPFWVAIIMGTVTGAAGGVMRDILINEEPLIFRRDIYAMACVVGGLVYWVGWLAGWQANAVQVLTAVTVIGVRLLAVQYHWGLPVLRGDSMSEEPMEDLRLRGYVDGLKEARTVSIVLDREEYDLFMRTCGSHAGRIGICELPDDCSELSFSEEAALFYLHEIEDMYVFEGFDVNYNHRPKGIVYRRIIDRFFDGVGWSH